MWKIQHALSPGGHERSYCNKKSNVLSCYILNSFCNMLWQFPLLWVPLQNLYFRITKAEKLFGGLDLGLDAEWEF